jgi:hypothetical protein
MIGVGDTATGNNQMRFGSTTVNNGEVVMTPLSVEGYWKVFINGTEYCLLLHSGGV